jgi:hypothetical protein
LHYPPTAELLSSKRQQHAATQAMLCMVLDSHRPVA